MLRLIAQMAYLGGPLVLAAVIHGFCLKYGYLSRLKRPMDLGATFRGRRLFGDNKTWRGFLVNLVGSVLGTAIQARLSAAGLVPDWLCLTDYRENWLLLGLLLGAGMTLGELPNSFLKRQMNIGPGQAGRGWWGAFFFYLDQVDLVIGVWVLTYWLIRPGWDMIAGSFVLALVLHLAVSLTGYVLGMRKRAI